MQKSVPEQTMSIGQSSQSKFFQKAIEVAPAAATMDMHAVG